MDYWFPEDYKTYAPPNPKKFIFSLDWRWRIFGARNPRVVTWQYKGPPGLKEYCRARGIPFSYVEDGFLRSVALGARKVPPLSLAFNSQDMYFNARSPTDLEDILRTYDFDGDPDLLVRARNAIRLIQSAGLSKYNASPSVDIEQIYGPKTTTRILVVGQVERDASIEYGCDPRMTNNDLVRMARRENPDAHIIYKPHPDVVHGLAGTVSDPENVRDAVQILEQDVALADALQTIDHVYTITSLAGFEALLRGITVTTAGCPFYSGWGLTDDRQPNPRRGRALTVEQVFAAAYILYAKYVDPQRKVRIEIEDAISLLQRDIAVARPETAQFR